MKEPIKDTVALLNTTDLSPVMDSTDLMRVAEIVKASSASNHKAEDGIEISVTVAQLSSTAPIQVSIIVSCCRVKIKLSSVTKFRPNSF